MDYLAASFFSSVEDNGIGYYIAYGVFILAIAAFVVYLLCKILAVSERTIQSVTRRRRPSFKRDPRRAFTDRQKRAAGDQCHWRCEGTGLFYRCRHEGTDLQGDHWYPYARGGATNMQNLVMLCPKCNNKKSDKIPSMFQTKALSRRRKKHEDYESSIVPKPGYWLPRNYNQNKVLD